MAVELRAPGVSLALAFAEQLAAHGDVHGLLFGHDADQTRTIITDTGSQQHKCTVVDVQVFSQAAFFDGNGTVDEAAVAACAASHPQQLLGWFSFRANAPLLPSMRELAVHAQIERLEAFRRVGESAEARPALFAMLTTSSSVNASTHSLDYRFVRRETPSSPLGAVELEITNLRQDSKAEFGAFRATSSVSALAEATSVLQPFSDPLTSPGVQAIEGFCEAVQTRIHSLVEQLVQAEEEELAVQALLQDAREQHALAKGS